LLVEEKVYKQIVELPICKGFLIETTEDFKEVKVGNLVLTIISAVLAAFRSEIE